MRPLFLTLNHYLTAKQRLLKNTSVLLAIFIFTVSKSVAQENLIVTLTPAQANLSQTLYDCYLFTLQDTFTENATLIQLNNPILLQEDGLLTFNLPGFGSVEAEAIDVRYRAANDYVWSAQINNYDGYLCVVEKPVGRAAFIQIEGESFDILPLTSTVYVLRKIANGGEEFTCATTQRDTETPEEILHDCVEDNDCAAVINILVLIPPDASDWFIQRTNNPFVAQLYLALGCEAVNIGFANSGIPNKRVIYSFANIPSFPYGVVPKLSDAIRDLPAIGSPLREPYSADLVVMLTSVNLEGGAGIASNVNFNFGDPNSAYGIVELDSHIGASRWTFAHEVGHLLGCTHDRNSPAPPGGCNYGWVIGGLNTQRTIMAQYVDNDSRRVLHYSNPHIQYNGSPTGQNPTDYNAKVIRNSACRVAAFQLDASLRAFIIAPDEVIVDWENPITLMAEIQQPGGNNPGLPPYTYEWRYSRSGVFSPADPGTLIGYDHPQVFSIPAFYWRYIFVQLKVTSSDNITVTATKKIKLRYIIHHLKLANDNQGDNTVFSVLENLPSIAPNPMGGEGEIRFRLNTTSRIRIEVFNLVGQKVLSVLDEDLKEGLYAVPIIENGKMPVGHYICHVLTNREKYALPIIVKNQIK